MWYTEVMKKPVLFFIQGPVPTPEDSKFAEEITDSTGLRVAFRNTQWAAPGDTDFTQFADVVGHVPDFYDLPNEFAYEVDSTLATTNAPFYDKDSGLMIQESGVDGVFIAVSQEPSLTIDMLPESHDAQEVVEVSEVQKVTEDAVVEVVQAQEVVHNGEARDVIDVASDAPPVVKRRGRPAKKAAGE